MWTDEQWTAFCALLGQWWPGEFSAAARAAWRVALDGLPPDVASVTLQRMLHSGSRFRPSVSEFLAAAREDPSAPTWDEAYGLVYRCAARQQVPSDLHPLIARFIDCQGLERLGRLPLDDPDWGEKTRRDLEAAWDVHVQTFERREVSALASGGGLKKLGPAVDRPQLETS